MSFSAVESTERAMLGCEDMVALTDLPLRAQSFGRIRAGFCDGLGIKKKPKSVLEPVFLESFLCFEKIVSMKRFAEILSRWIRFQRRGPEHQDKKEGQ